MSSKHLAHFSPTYSQIQPGYVKSRDPNPKNVVSLPLDVNCKERRCYLYLVR